MFDITVKGNECIIPTKQLIDLLEIKLLSLLKAQEEDSSWNYPIKEYEVLISELKSTL